MAEATVKLDDAELKEGMHAAILAALGEKGQQMIVEETIKYLTTPVQEPYGDKREISPLAKKVEFIAYQIAEAIIKEKFENDPKFKEALDGLISEAVSKVFNTGPEREALINRMTNKISEAMQGLWR